MKRKPIEIMADVINTLNGLQMNKEYHINEIKKRSQIHWETALNYALLIHFVQEYAPKIQINAEKKYFSLATHSKQLTNSTVEEQLIMYLFLEKAFSSTSSIKAYDLWNHFPQNKIDTILQSKYVEMEEISNEKQFYINTKGKFKAQALLASINRSMGEFIDSSGQNIRDGKETFVIKPFRCEQPLSNLRKPPQQIEPHKEEIDHLYDPYFVSLFTPKQIKTNMNRESEHPNQIVENRTASATLA